MSSSLNITRVFGSAWRIYREHWGVLLLVAIVIFALPLTALFVLVTLDPQLDSGVAVLFGLFYVFMFMTGQFWYRAFCTHLVLAKRTAQPVRFGGLVRATFKGFPRVSTVGTLVLFGTIGGLLLLIVPGLIFAARRSPAISVAVAEGKGAFYGRHFRDPQHSAMRRSRDLVKGSGNSFEMFGVITVKQVVYGVFNSIFPLLLVFVVPWGALAVTLSYFELVDMERGVQPGHAAFGQAPDAAWRPRPGVADGFGSALRPGS